MPLLQGYYLQICRFNAIPISLCLVLSLSLTIPIIGALFLETMWGFVSGIICMIIAWILVLIYKKLPSTSTSLKSEIMENRQTTTDHIIPMSNLEEFEDTQLHTK